MASPCATTASLTVCVQRLTALATSAAAAAAVPTTAASAAAPAAVPTEELAELAASREEGCRHALWAAGLHGLALEWPCQDSNVVGGCFLVLQSAVVLLGLRCLMWNEET